MNSYVNLSKIYDQWQEKNDPAKWADHVEKIIAKHCKIDKGDGADGSYLLLDLGCGTGGFAIEMAERGYDVLGMDLSGDMLAVAREKDSAQTVQFIQQDMTRMELFGTVDLIVCFLDTVNHVLEESKLNQLFRSCKNYLNPNGLLIFDLATPRYFEQVLGNQMFFDIKESYALIWQNAIDFKKGRSRSDLTFFISQEDGSYLRGEECIKEKIYPVQKIESLIEANHLTVLKQYDGLSFRKPAADKFDGFVSLEWVKRWSKDIEDAAIVFPHFVNYMQRYHTQTGTKDAHTIKERTMRPYDKDILINITLAGLMDKMASEYPTQEAFVFPQFNLRYTYQSFKEEALRVACGFTAIGIKKGDHVAIWATNYPEWIFTLFACAKIGAILVTVNTSYKIHEAEYLLRQSDTSTLVMIDGFKDSNYIEIIHEICPELADSKQGELKSKRLPCLKNVIAVASPIKGAYHWSELKKLGESVDRNELVKIQKGMNEHETINMQYTSGTTGFPKGVMLTHYNIINNGKNIGDCMDFSTKDRLLICVPLFHCFGLVLATMASFTHATTMVVVDFFQPLKVLNVLQKEKCTAMHGVPTMFIACLEHPDFNTFNLSHIRTGIMAGSPCPIKVMQEVVDKMHMSEITIVYGQTEASPGCTQTRTDDSLEKRVSTVGKELPGVECKIVDPQTNVELKSGQIGEFVARGYNIMKGYYNMPEATAAVIDKDGWLHTGDLATKDEDGYYKITGRLKDMIIRGGENIYPMEIEEFLYTHPDIKDVQVVGVPDKTYGEEVFAAIIPKEGAKVTEEGIRDYVRSHMARHKVPKYVKFVDSFPMTASGKIQKFKIRDMAVEEFNLQMDSAIETA